MPSRPYILAECLWENVCKTSYDVAILPWGATEAHNFHLPYCTDTLQAERVAAESARLAWEKGARVLVLPPIPFGVQTGQSDLPFCINLNPSTQTAILRDVILSIAPHGIRKFVIFNSHGGNCFKQIIRELQPISNVLLCQINWWQTVKADPFFDTPGDHAGELESSMLYYLAPDITLPVEKAGPGYAKPTKVKGFRDGTAWMQRQWSKVTADTGVGDPKNATAAKGEKYFAAATKHLGEFFYDLAVMDPNDLYEQK
jgi:creatinine amidohydrolase